MLMLNGPFNQASNGWNICFNAIFFIASAEKNKINKQEGKPVLLNKLHVFLKCHNIVTRRIQIHRYRNIVIIIDCGNHERIQLKTGLSPLSLRQSG